MLSLLALALAQTPKPLTVSPAADPRPALQYELLPPFRDRTPDNAALAYSRAFAPRPRPPADPAVVKAQNDALERWLADPLDRLPKDDLRKYVADRRRVFAELDRAAAADHCDWGLLSWIGPGDVDAVLDISSAREAARDLAVRTRLALAEGRFADAAASLRTTLQMAKHVGEAPTTIRMLVGLALAAQVQERIDDWIACPDSPNLYWALTALPEPLIDPRPGLDGEAAFFDRHFPHLVALRAGPVPADRAGEIADAVMADIAGMNGPAEVPDPVEAGLAKTVGKVAMGVFIAANLPAAKAELLALGRTAADIDKMPPAQVVFLAPFERVIALRDDLRKWTGIPYHRAGPELKALSARAKAGLASDPTAVVYFMAVNALPATEKTFWAVARTDRRVRFLRTLEAIRLHMAAHGGTPPATLADITAVPVPDDPITDKPFGYEVKGNVVVLSGGPPDGEKAHVGNSLRYEITVRRP